MTSAEREQNKKAGHELEAQNGFVKENVGWFRYKPSGDWFCFAKVRKLCFIRFCEWEFFFSHSHITFPRGMRVTHRYYIIRLLLLMAVRYSEREVFITFEIWIFIFQKRMDSLQGAIIHPPEPCKGRFITECILYFKSSERDPANTRLVPL